MVNHKKPGPGPALGDNAKDRHNKERKHRAIIDWTVPAPADLVARPDVPKTNSKHKSYFEFVENTEKKKKLEYQVTSNAQPPPGFDFVPIGNPELSNECKDMSREQGVMMFIVAIDSRTGLTHREDMVHEIGRIGFHFRQAIVDAARVKLGLDTDSVAPGQGSKPEPIPQTQTEINQQADAAIRDLFPRIPHTDRQAIVDRAFKMDDNKVGMSSSQPLSKRVQLAVLAHIRHTYTRYDQLLKETNWENARKAVETLCLDYLVKWRGDEENGRDQLDEVLREVIVISDSESDGDSEEYDSTDDSSSVASVESLAERSATEAQKSTPGAARPCEPVPRALGSATEKTQSHTKGIGHALRAISKGRSNRVKKKHAKHVKKRQQRKAKAGPAREPNAASRGFKRYQAVRDQAWHEAVKRQRLSPQRPSFAGPIPGHGQPPSSAASPWNDPSGSLSFDHSDFRVAPASTRMEEPYMAPNQRPPARDIHRRQALTPDAYAPRVRPPGSPVAAGNQPYQEQASPRGGPLRDYLVKSIEPSSPDTSSFPRPYVQGSNFLPRHLSPLHAAPLLGHGPIRNPPSPSSQGFIQLPPRERPGIVESRLPQERSKAYAPMNGASRASPTYMPIKRDDSYIQRNPDSGRLYRSNVGSESDPIIIGSSPYRAPGAEAPGMPQVHGVLGGTLAGPPIAKIIDLRTGSPSSPPPRRQELRTDRHIPQFADGGLVNSSDIVRVSNVFPRRYEPQRATSPIPRYNLRSAPHSSVGRIMGRVDGPRYKDERPPPPTQSHNPSESYPRRQERVVAVEYIPVETRPNERDYGRGRFHPSYRDSQLGYYPPPRPAGPGGPHSLHGNRSTPVNFPPGQNLPAGDSYNPRPAPHDRSHTTF